MSPSVMILRPESRLNAESPLLATNRTNLTERAVLDTKSTPRPALRGSVVPPRSVFRKASAPSRYELGSTVRYRLEGRALTGTIVGITYGERLRYDIRPLLGADGRRNPALALSFGVPHESVEVLLAPPPDPPDERAIVLSELPAEPPAPIGQGAPRPPHKWSFFCRFLGGDVRR